MKLKTIKDLYWFDLHDRKGYCNQVINIEDLKKEVIKWVKDFRERKDEIWESDFMNFHNITEEDLK